MLQLSALGVDVLSTLWADNASSLRHGASAIPLHFRNRSKFSSKILRLFEIRAIREVVRVVARILKLVLSGQLCE